MRTTFTFLLSILVLSASAKLSTFEKLCDVNKCWLEQKDVSANMLPALPVQNETDWIRTHLSLVEHTLRSRSTAALTAAQQSNRMKCLDDLHEYMLAGHFPINEDHSFRTPIFIDNHDNFCAVGYLLKASGYEHVSRKISALTNLAYVQQMNYPELNEWAVQHGFTKDELAWIQPSYSPAMHATPVGHGVTGGVQELFVENTTGRMFVGGTFSHVDNTIVANNVAYVTESAGVYTWHSMGAGVNGPVNAITSHAGSIFVAGSFSMAGSTAVNNVARWDGSAWHAAGCITGTVHDLVVFQGELFASGEFDVCGSPACNFAKWNGSVWQPLPGLNGRVNTMEPMGTTLLLGGAFTVGTSTANVIKWTASGGFQTFANSINNEVKDFEMYDGSMFASCRQTDPADSIRLLMKLNGTAWQFALTDTNYMLGFLPESVYYSTPGEPRSFNTLCAESASLSMGGQFFYAPMMGTAAHNTFNMAAPHMGGTGNWFYVDSAVNKMVVFNGNVIAGGKFKYGYGSLAGDTLNGLARRYSGDLSARVPEQPRSLRIYPNPVSYGGELAIENNFNASHFTLRDLTSRIMKEGELVSGRQQITFPSLPAGIYLLEVKSEDGVVVTRKVSVE